MRVSNGAPASAGAFSPAEVGAPFSEPLGATLLDKTRCHFRVWAPARKQVELHIIAPRERRLPMTKSPDGYFEITVDDCPPGTRYLYRLDGGDERPDPASRLQPEGVHKASEVVAREFQWQCRDWRGIPLEDYVGYELHAGTFTNEGTFDVAIERLDHLRDLGITAVELLPIAQFPGTRNWGYDGVYIGAVQDSYGGPAALKRFVDACHQRGMAVILDVVYNHLGPEGNYLAQFGPYFTGRYKTPWGLALNFDGPRSDHVRWFFIHNALQWVDEFRIDALRVDAVHAIVDHSAEPFLQDLTTAVRHRASQLGRKIYTIAESDLNDPRVITPGGDLGLGFDSQWNDDFHHSLHVLMTGEQEGYYEGFGKVSDFARVFQRGYLYVGQHSTYRGRKYGCLPKTRDGKQFVVFAQNHDQVGNRMVGDRLSTLVSPEQLRLTAAVVALAPFVPMLFMGEEYGEKAPFQYFTSHGDTDLIEAVRKGRSEEFDDFKSWAGDPPDCHDEETFNRSKLNWSLLDRDEHASLLRLYQDLFRLRRETPALRNLDLTDLRTEADDERKTLIVYRGDVVLAFNFGESARRIDLVRSDRPLPLAGEGGRRPGEGPPFLPLIESNATIASNTISLPPFGFAVLRRA